MFCLCAFFFWREETIVDWQAPGPVGALCSLARARAHRAKFRESKAVKAELLSELFFFPPDGRRILWENGTHRPTSEVMTRDERVCCLPRPWCRSKTKVSLEIALLVRPTAMTSWRHN